MGELIPLFGAFRAKGDTAAGRPEFDPLANLLSVTKHWQTGITQIAGCQINLADQSQKRVEIDLADLERKLRLLLKDHTRSNG